MLLAALTAAAALAAAKTPDVYEFPDLPWQFSVPKGFQKTGRARWRQKAMGGDFETTVEAFLTEHANVPPYEACVRCLEGDPLNVRELRHRAGSAYRFSCLHSRIFSFAVEESGKCIRLELSYLDRRIMEAVPPPPALFDLGERALDEMQASLVPVRRKAAPPKRKPKTLKTQEEEEPEPEPMGSAPDP